MTTVPSAAAPERTSSAASGPAAVPVAGSSAIPMTGLKNLEYATASSSRGLEAVEVGALATRMRKDSGQTRGVGLGAIDRGAGADRHHQVTRPGAGHLRGNTASEVIFGQAKRPGQFCPILDGRAEYGCRLVHRHHRAFPGAVNAHRKHVLTDLLGEPVLSGGQPPAARQPEPGAERVVPCAVYFGADWGE